MQIDGCNKSPPLIWLPWRKVCDVIVRYVFLSENTKLLKAVDLQRKMSSWCHILICQFLAKLFRPPGFIVREENKKGTKTSLRWSWWSCYSTSVQCSACKWNRPLKNQHSCGLVSVHCPSSSPQHGRNTCWTAEFNDDRWLQRVDLQ